jgi:hypothetical protein
MSGSIAIVEFVADKTVDIVPTNWINGDEAFWAPFSKEKLERAVKKREQPQLTWQSYKVRILQLTGRTISH